jgi:hypothetical protein
MATAVSEGLTAIDVTGCMPTMFGGIKLSAAALSDAVGIVQV